MKILKIFAIADNPFKYNYHINYGVWDKIPGDSEILETFGANLNDYDTVFLPMYSRWIGNEKLLDTIKNHKIRKVLFDNDSCYRSFDDPFYDGIDHIFYRCPDKHGKTKGSHLIWSVDTRRMTPVYGGCGVAFSCSMIGYPLRKEIDKHIAHTREIGIDYIERLQSSAAAIHTNSKTTDVTRAKVLEFAACGTQIISNRTPDMGLYFPDDLITYFDTVEELIDIVRDFKANIDTQKKLRQIVEERHTDQIRATQIIEKLCE